jgi:hypothetical protein
VVATSAILWGGNGSGMAALAVDGATRATNPTAVAIDASVFFNRIPFEVCRLRRRQGPAETVTDMCCPQASDSTTVRRPDLDAENVDTLRGFVIAPSHTSKYLDLEHA